MSLQNFIEQKLLKKINGVPIDQIKKKFRRAIYYFNHAKNSLHYTPREIVYSNIYNAIRIAGESLILLWGYKATIKDHHKTVIEVSKIIISNDSEMDDFFKRLNKIRKNRHEIDYEDLDITSQSVEQALKDAHIFLTKIRDIIRDKEQQQILI